jgi:polar amino acid transport system ATP-binding protein
MISIRNLYKSYGDNLVLENISVDIEDDEVVAIIGPSGCGKSTFIRCINLLEQPDSGQIFIGGEEITKKGADIEAIRRRLGMVFQSFNLFSHKTVLENIILAPMNVLKMPQKQAVREAMEYLEMVGISNRADHMPDQLSGGQKQRVAIARCLAMHPEVILFDEPTSALDPTMVDEVLSVIRKLVKSGLSCIIVTHEMNFARNAATTVFYMDDRGIYEKRAPAQI